MDISKMLFVQSMDFNFRFNSSKIIILFYLNHFLFSQWEKSFFLKFAVNAQKIGERGG